MRIECATVKKGFLAAQLILIFSWLSHLVYTDSYFSVYALTCIAASVCLLQNVSHNRHMKRLPFLLNMLLASLLSLTVTLANYPIFQRLRNMNEISMSTNRFLNVLEAVLTFAGGIVVFYHIFLWLVSTFPMEGDGNESQTSGKHPVKVFFTAFLSLSLIYLVYLFFVVYPGSVTSDSIWQIRQTVSGEYTNHHPYWHTITIKLFMTIGYALFGDANAAAATFNAFQSLFMAACFAYAVVTLYQYRIPKSWVVLVYASFAVLPNHITYSCTVWKDVPFGLFMLLLVVAMFRIMWGMGKNRGLNFVILFIAGIGTAVMRSNGWYAMLAAFVMLAVFFRKRCRELILPWAIVLVIGWIMNGPVMTALGVDQMNFIEALSVPLQQIARVVTNGGELTNDEIEFLDTMLDYEEIPDIYTEQCVDPIKDAIRLKNYPYLREHKSEFFKLWIQIGLRYPWEYVEAWVEETKGYWNGGYDYYIYAQYVSDNDYGMYMVEQSNIIHKLVKAYFTLTRETVFFEPLQSIGLHVWVLSMLCFFNLLHNRKEFLLTVPLLAVVFTLWLTTPVFSEFRYAYCLFTSLPFVLPVSLYRKSDETEQ